MVVLFMILRVNDRCPFFLGQYPSCDWKFPAGNERTLPDGLRLDFGGESRRFMSAKPCWMLFEPIGQIFRFELFAQRPEMAC